MGEDASKPLLSITAAAEELLKKGAVGVLITAIDKSPQIGSKILVDESGVWVGSLGDEELDRAVVKHAGAFPTSREETRAVKVAEFAPEVESFREVVLLFELIRPEPRIVICGAGHVGAALARLASFVGFHITIIDDRAEFVARDRFQDRNIDLILARNWGDAVTEAIGIGRGVAVAVVTRGHNEDEQCMGAVVTTNADYIGLIGSKRRTAIVINRLREAGAPADTLQRIRAPIGLDIGAVTPEEVALAILAEIVAERRGGKGGSLSWRR